MGLKARLRRLAERFARGRTLTRSICVNGSKHRIRLSPDAQLKYLKGGGYSEANNALVRLAEKKIEKGFNVWDIGASCGLFSLAAAVASVDGKVLSVEADGWQLALIEETKKYKENSTFDITTLCCAISDGVGLEKFNIAERGRASNSLAKLGIQAQMGGSRFQTLTSTVDLDLLLAKTFSPQFVKIDIEGAEMMALKGAERLLSDVRPLVLIEVRESNENEIANLFHNFRYRAKKMSVAPSSGGHPLRAWDVLFTPCALS